MSTNQENSNGAADAGSEQSHVVITIDDDSSDKIIKPGEKPENASGNPSGVNGEVDLEDDSTNEPDDAEEATDSDIEVLTSYEEYMKKREEVEEKQRELQALEDSQLKIFNSLKRFDSNSRISPSVRAGSYQTVTFELKEVMLENEELVPFPREFSSIWSKDYVPMPCAEQNERTVKVRLRKKFQGSDGSEEEKVVITNQTLNLWERLKVLLKEPFSSCEDLTERMNHFGLKRNTGNVLKYTIEEMMTADEGYNFFSKVLPKMVELCLDLPNILTRPLPLLRRFVNHSISLSQKQVASLLANAFFSTFPDKLQDDDNYPSINLDVLFSCEADDPRFFSQANKLRCILHYFERIADKMPNGVVTYTRKSFKPEKLPDWNKSRYPLTKLVALSNGTIETNGTGMLQVDFANKYLGGGVLGRGAVQEEILFVIYPELLISRLFSEKLSPTETVLITGCERFSTYKGYSDTLEYTGDFQDTTVKDSAGRKQTQFVAMDAYYVRKKWAQFHPKFVERELNKAFVGFSTNSTVAIASGKWGCGAFNGDPVLKSILQLLAASQAQRDLVLFTFGDTELQKQLLKIMEYIHDRAVGDIWTLLNRYYDIFCKSTETAPLQTLSQYIPEHFSNRIWDGYQYVAQEMYEPKMFTLTQPRSPIPSDDPPDETAISAAWREDQALLSTLDSFKLTNTLDNEFTDSNGTPAFTPACKFALDINPDTEDSSEPSAQSPDINATANDGTENGCKDVDPGPETANSDQAFIPVVSTADQESAPIQEVMNKVVVDIIAAGNEAESKSQLESENGSPAAGSAEEGSEAEKKPSPCSSWKEWKESQSAETKKRKASGEAPGDASSPVHRPRYFQ